MESYHSSGRRELNCRTKLLFIFLLSALFTVYGVTGDIIVQDKAFCGSLQYPKERALKESDDESVPSQRELFYLPGKDCVVSIIGKTGYQFSVTVDFLQVDKNAVLDPVTKEPIKCYDYLNLYDSPRIDHAKRLTPITGLCGNQVLPQLRTFVTSCQFLSIEFVTDPDHDSYRGFNLKVVQYPRRSPSNIYPGDRPTCAFGYDGPIPAVRVDTTARLQSLRDQFTDEKIDAYVIPAEDAHSSEYVSGYDARLKYISGFSGLVGIAVVTTTQAALWTEDKYFLEAEDELDCNWILMKTGEIGVPSMTEWLMTEWLTAEVTSCQRVAIATNPFVHPISTWLDYQSKLNSSGIDLVQITPDLIDTIWTTDRPTIPSGPVEVHPLIYAGVSWPEKMERVRNHLSMVNVTALVVTSLDEIAWLYNLRGSDIPYNPFFISHGIVEQNRTRLYLRNHTMKLYEASLRDHLNTNQDGTCTGRTRDCVEVKSYDSVRDDVQVLAENSSTAQVWISHFCNYAICGVIPSVKRYQQSSPIALMKSIKNDVEREGMRNSHIRDAIALITFFQKLEKEVKEGKNWTEVSAAEELVRYRGQQDLNKGLSFGSISASGSNGAIIHYRPSEATNKQITTTEMYLLDSGGQYLDGTTDVTRTFHFGTPSDYEKEAYTRVLMGSIDLALLVWPAGLYGRDMDVLARAPLFKAGLIYKHSTGHGIGSYLSAHEGPGRIAMGYRPDAYEEKLYEGMFFSDGPGYYEDGQFGIRLETVVEIVKADTPCQHKDTKFLAFHPITLVPFEPKLILHEMLNAEQISWLNDYHKKVMDIVGKRLQDEGLTEAYDWVAERVKPFDKPVFKPVTLVASAPYLSWHCLILITAFLGIHL